MHRYILVFLFFQSFYAMAGAMDKSQFQSKVYEYLKSNYSGYSFEMGATADVIKLGEIEIGLQNIYNTYSKESLDRKQLDLLLADHFSRLLPQILNQDSDSLVPWVEAKSKVRPQLAPKEYLDRLALVSDTLDEKVIIACVIDSENGYKYVTAEDLREWNISQKELMDQAISNLDQASKKIPLQVSLDREKFIGIQVMDGYDAARILIPGIRRFAAEKLGSPFYAALSNRDFLIMWSGENSEGFKSFAIDKTAKDYIEQPYPLTPNVFRVTESTIDVAK